MKLIGRSINEKIMSIFYNHWGLMIDISIFIMLDFAHIEIDHECKKK